MPRAARELVQLGAVTGAHGVRGAVRLVSFTERPEDIAAYGPLCDETGARHFTLRSVRAAKGGLVARIDGVDERDAAEALKGTALYVPRAALPAPDAESWYQADLVGLAVETRTGDRFGLVAAIVNYGAGDLVEIALDGSDRRELVPFTRVFVPEVDVAGGRLVVNLPDDFLATDEKKDAADD